MQGFDLMILGLAMFFGVHLITGIYELRAKMAALMGESGYRMAHALFSLGGLVLLGMGYSGAPFEPLYDPPAWGATVTISLMPLAIILLASTHMYKDISRITRHPMMWGIALFSTLHLLANGDQATVMIFAPFLAYSLLAMRLSDRKMRLKDPEKWSATESNTSVVPFAAIRQGRAAPRSGASGMRVVIAGLVTYALLAYGHQWFIGVALPIG